MPIDPETGRYITPYEAGPKVGNLISTLKAYIHQGTFKELAGLLERVPQEDELGRYKYLLTFSGAVDLLTGSEVLRSLDMMVMDWGNNMWEFYGTNFDKPELYFARLPFNRDVAKRLNETSTYAYFSIDDSKYEVRTISPVILLHLRLASLFFQELQPNEVEDAKKLIDYLKQHKNYSSLKRGTSMLWKYIPAEQKQLIDQRIRDLTK